MAIAATDVDAIVSAHRFTTRHRFWTVETVCGCGYRRKFWRGTFWPTILAFTQADHWAALAGVKKWRNPWRR